MTDPRRYPPAMLDVIEAWHTAVNAGDGTAAGLTPDDEVTRRG